MLISQMGPQCQTRGAVRIRSRSQARLRCRWSQSSCTHIDLPRPFSYHHSYTFRRTRPSGSHRRSRRCDDRSCLLARLDRFQSPFPLTLRWIFTHLLQTKNSYIGRPRRTYSLLYRRIGLQDVRGSHVQATLRGTTRARQGCRGAHPRAGWRQTIERTSFPLLSTSPSYASDHPSVSQCIDRAFRPLGAIYVGSLLHPLRSPLSLASSPLSPSSSYDYYVNPRHLGTLHARVLLIRLKVDRETTCRLAVVLYLIHSIKYKFY